MDNEDNFRVELIDDIAEKTNEYNNRKRKYNDIGSNLLDDVIIYLYIQDLKQKNYILTPEQLEALYQLERIFKKHGIRDVFVSEYYQYFKDIFKKAQKEVMENDIDMIYNDLTHEIMKLYELNNKRFRITKKSEEQEKTADYVKEKILKSLNAIEGFENIESVDKDNNVKNAFKKEASRFSSYAKAYNDTLVQSVNEGTNGDNDKNKSIISELINTVEESQKNFQEKKLTEKVKNTAAEILKTAMEKDKQDEQKKQLNTFFSIVDSLSSKEKDDVAELMKMTNIVTAIARHSKDNDNKNFESVLSIIKAFDSDSDKNKAIYDLILNMKKQDVDSTEAINTLTDIISSIATSQQKTKDESRRTIKTILQAMSMQGGAAAAAQSNEPPIKVINRLYNTLDINLNNLEGYIRQFAEYTKSQINESDKQGLNQKNYTSLLLDVDKFLDNTGNNKLKNINYIPDMGKYKDIFTSLKNNIGQTFDNIEPVLNELTKYIETLYNSLNVLEYDNDIKDDIKQLHLILSKNVVPEIKNKFQTEQAKITSKITEIDAKVLGLKALNEKLELDAKRKQELDLKKEEANKAIKQNNMSKQSLDEIRKIQNQINAYEESYEQDCLILQGLYDIKTNGKNIKDYIKDIINSVKNEPSPPQTGFLTRSMTGLISATNLALRDKLNDGMKKILDKYIKLTATDIDDDTYDKLIKEIYKHIKSSQHSIIGLYNELKKFGVNEDMAAIEKQLNGKLPQVPSEFMQTINKSASSVITPSNTTSTPSFTTPPSKTTLTTDSSLSSGDMKIPIKILLYDDDHELSPPQETPSTQQSEQSTTDEKSTTKKTQKNRTTTNKNDATDTKTDGLESVKEKFPILFELFNKLKEINTAMQTYLKEQIESGIHSSSVQQSTDESSLFDNIWNEYQTYINSRTDDAPIKADEKLYERVRMNDLDPARILKVNFEDKVIFAILLYFMRFAVIIFIEILIDYNVIKTINTALGIFIFLFIIVFFTIIIIINYDSYKLRIIFNYLNLHVNSTKIYFIFALTIMFYIIVYVITNANENALEDIGNFLDFTHIYKHIYNFVETKLPDEKGYFQDLSDKEKLKLQYRLEVITMIVYIFSAFIVLVI